MDRICRTLVSAGHEVTLVGRERTNSLPLPEKPYRQVRLPMKFQAGKFFYLEYNWKLSRWLKANPCDAINTVDLDTILAGYLAKQPEQKWVFDAHEYFSETPEVIHRPVIRGIWQRLARWLIPKTDVRYTVGPKLATIFQLEHGVEFGVVRNVPEGKKKKGEQATDQFSTTAESKKIILYQGMLNRGRGLEVAIAAMRLLPDTYTLWLAGNGDLLEELQRSSIDLQEQGRVRFLGFVPMEQLPDLTRRAWLGLNLLDAVSPSYYYSLANKCFDYIQAGVPSVQMDFPEYQALQDKYDCFVLLPELDANKLAGVILSTDESGCIYTNLHKNNKLAAAELNWERERNILLSLWA